MSIQSVKKQNEQLQTQITQLQKLLKEKDKENKDLIKKLEKFEKLNKSSSSSKKIIKLKTTSSSSSSESGDDENLLKLARMNKNSLLNSSQLRLSLKELEQRRSIREQANRKEEMITNIQKECLRKCNQYLSIILSDFGQKWNTFEEIDMLKKNENTITFNRLQEKIDQQTTQYLILCEVNLWESEVKYKTARDLMECYQASVEEILVLKSVS